MSLANLHTFVDKDGFEWLQYFKQVGEFVRLIDPMPTPMLFVDGPLDQCARITNFVRQTWRHPYGHRKTLYVQEGTNLNRIRRERIPPWWDDLLLVLYKQSSARDSFRAGCIVYISKGFVIPLKRIMLDEIDGVKTTFIRYVYRGIYRGMRFNLCEFENYIKSIRGD